VPAGCSAATLRIGLSFSFNQIDICDGCFKFQDRNETGNKTIAGLMNG
jgi:hypothetical protein